MTSGPGAVAVPFDVEEALRRVEALMLEETATDETLLTRMARDLLEAGGKRLRPRVALLAYGASGGDAEGLTRVVEAAAGFELIHTATLVHDDIIDQSPLRRGTATLHTRYGTPHAIVAGDLLFTRAFGLSARQPPAVVEVTLEACTRLAEGQVLEQRVLGEDLDVETYMRIIAGKTAEPIRACGKVGALLADADPGVVEALGEYGLKVGLAFQIQDDLLDILGNPEEMGKVAGTDAKTGVRTLPALLAGWRTGREDLAPEETVGLLQDPELIESAKQVALDYVAEAKHHLEVVPASPHRAALEAIADRVVARRS